MRCATIIRSAALVVSAALFCSQSFASVVITGTRLVYPAMQKEITIKLDNTGTRPALVQSWVDSGDVESSPTNSKAPFLLSPPVSRIDPGKGQALRLMFTGAALPNDKESVFWLNVLEIPPKTEGSADQNLLQMAFRSRIKIFYRPDGLVGNAIDAPQQLQWEVVPAQGAYILQAYNPTAFHVSLVELALTIGSQRYEGESGMVGPGETQTFTVPTLKSKPGSSALVEFKSINDYGALAPVKQSLKP